VTVSLKVENDIVKEATFEGSGCAISTASASLMTEAVKGKTLDAAKALFSKFHALITSDSQDSRDIEGLGKLAAFSGVCQYPARVKCATLAWHTVKAAMEQTTDSVTTE
jgi:nitrogen fixation protein NifU and related proteins